MPPPRAGTTKSVQIRSSVPSAAARTARRGRLRRGFRRRSLTDAAYPLRVRALRTAERTPAVGRDHWARRCRNYPLHTNPFVCTVSRCAERMGHAPSLHFYGDFLFLAHAKARKSGQWPNFRKKSHYSTNLLRLRIPAIYFRVFAFRNATSSSAVPPVTLCRSNTSVSERNRTSSKLPKRLTRLSDV